MVNCHLLPRCCLHSWPCAWLGTFNWFVGWLPLNKCDYFVSNPMSNMRNMVSIYYLLEEKQRQRNSAVPTNCCWYNIICGTEWWGNFVDLFPFVFWDKGRLLQHCLISFYFAAFCIMGILEWNRIWREKPGYEVWSLFSRNNVQIEQNIGCMVKFKIAIIVEAEWPKT